MAVTSNRLVQINMTGDVEYVQEFSASINTAGSGQNQLINLSPGNNSITVPSGAIAVTIIPPSNNAAAIKLRGVNGDAGISLALTDPCSLSLASVSSFVLNAGDTITGLRLIYS